MAQEKRDDDEEIEGIKKALGQGFGQRGHY